MSAFYLREGEFSRITTFTFTNCTMLPADAPTSMGIPSWKPLIPKVELRQREMHDTRVKVLGPKRARWS